MQEAAGRGLRRERVFRDRSHPLDMYCDAELQKRYRFSRQGCIFIIDLLEEELRHPTTRSQALPASLQVFLALAFFASGALLTTIATMHGVSIASSSRAIRQVTKALFQGPKFLTAFSNYPNSSMCCLNFNFDTFFRLH